MYDVYFPLAIPCLRMHMASVFSQSLRHIWPIRVCPKPWLPWTTPMTGNGFFNASIKMVMTWGWFMALGFPHYHIFHTSQPHPFLGQLPMCVAALRTMSTQFLPAHLWRRCCVITTLGLASQAFYCGNSRVSKKPSPAGNNHHTQQVLASSGQLYIYILCIYIYMYIDIYCIYIYICHDKPVRPVTVTVVGLLLYQVLPSLKAAKASAALTICTSSSDLAPTAIPSPIWNTPGLYGPHFLWWFPFI